MAEQLLDSHIQEGESLAISEIIRIPTNKDLFHDYSIEEPGKGLFIINSRIMISGWIVGKSPVIAVEIICGDQIGKEIPTSYYRHDVIKIYGNLAEEQKVNFGFREEILLNPTLSKKELVIKAIFSDGNRVPIIIIKLGEVNKNDLLKSNMGPDFLVIGAMKAATSAIYSYLVQHPRVIRRAPKEINFFSYEYEKGLDWYLSNFVAKQDLPKDKHFLIGDASPSYLNVKEVPQLVKEHFPNVKLIVSLRNPTERAISQYHHHVTRVGDERRSIEETFSRSEVEKAREVLPLIKGDKHRINQHIQKYGNTALYLLLGQYVSQLRNWLEFFPR